jgi:hypothetical protein
MNCDICGRPTERVLFQGQPEELHICCMRCEMEFNHAIATVRGVRQGGVQHDAIPSLQGLPREGCGSCHQSGSPRADTERELSAAEIDGPPEAFFCGLAVVVLFTVFGGLALFRYMGFI